MSVDIAGTTVYTLEEVSKQLDVSVAALRGYIDQGRLQAARVGRSYRVTAEALRAFLHPSSGHQDLQPGRAEDDPVLRVIGIGADGNLSKDPDADLYGGDR